MDLGAGGGCMKSELAQSDSDVPEQFQQKRERESLGLCSRTLQEL
jgi:hypothetical protein